jgi:PhzF family phenazine biosynthesis protein
MTVPFYLVDAFTERPFTGNGAAVCPLPRWPDDRWLQNVAQEMNQSETAFLVSRGNGFELRWLTPKVEVELCGHATLASAHVLWQEGLADPAKEIRFSTKSGTLQALRKGEQIELDFPLKPEEEVAPPPELSQALGVKLGYVGKNRFDYLVELESEAVLRAVVPDFKLLRSLPMRGIIVTSRSSDPRYDFVSRFFAPACGIDEDPVTGSAHCCLGDFWRKRLGKDEFRAYQASPRGGVVMVRVQGDRAFLGGRAVMVARGVLDARVD